MTALPARSIFDGTGLPTTSAMKTAMGQLRDYLNEILGSTGGAPTAITSINGGPLAGSRLKNGNKLVAQRGTSATVTAGTAVPTASTGYYTTDMFYAYCTGANVTLAQVAGSDATHKRDQFTGAASVTAIGHGYRLDAAESAHMAGQTCTYSVELANSLLTSVTWTAYYASTADAFGTIGTPTKTQIATGTFTVNSTVTKYSIQIALPAGATTGVEIVLTVGAQISGTWTIGREDFRPGSVSPTYFEVPDSAQELIRCQRYCEKSYGDGVAPGSASQGGAFRGVAFSGADFYNSSGINFKVNKRAPVAFSFWSPATGNPNLFRDETAVGDIGVPAVLTNSTTGATLYNSSSLLTAGRMYSVQWLAQCQIP
ncbi:hypothetical protein [Rhodoferax sp. GW822-FHT02A01]|uniref:hypothetical protein n=1 Tax=Rhodoferax sp. GW822-FHT02A01 TaxID=3141537 RepID=UPI00315C6DC5